MAAARRLREGAALRDVVDEGDMAAWLELDEGVRADDWYYYHRPYVVPAWETAEGGGALTESQLALALCHRDGRIRHRALGLVAGRPELLPLVLLRCADWAPPVRERARKRLAEALDTESAVRLAPLTLRIGARSRGDFAFGLVSGLLSRASAERFATLLTHPDRAVRRFAHRLAIEDGRLSPAELARTAARDDDAVVQSLCAEAALAALAEADAPDDVLEPLLAARSPRPRSAGVTALRRLGRPGRAMDFLADPAGLVRACARYVVRQHGTDPLPWYRDRCADPGDPALPPGAVIGLAECGGRADAALLWPLVAHPAPGVRARAVAGLRTLDVTDLPRMRALLDDPAPGVVREATFALLPSAALLPEDRLTERLGAERPRWVRVSAYRLLDARGGIVRLRAAVRTLDDPDERLRGRAELTVRQWHRSACATRTDAEVTELLAQGRRLLEGSAPLPGRPDDLS
ncbi:hypothetical protein ACIPSA_01980 [Streptomyces sp. NPDC086549]|uniref:hypothetical protein n=1 Tax=Streptomyces sp. NPDC086549 TaxID=3365752 RepID=UPI003817CE27